jgi:hypothetical protein
MPSGPRRTEPQSHWLRAFIHRLLTTLLMTQGESRSSISLAIFVFIGHSHVAVLASNYYGPLNFIEEKRKCDFILHRDHGRNRIGF